MVCLAFRAVADSTNPRRANLCRVTAGRSLLKPTFLCARGAMMRGVGFRLAVLALSGALWPLAANADERKQLAFDVVERNAEQMALLSDSIFYFGELGMQEFESNKLLKDTLEAAGFKVEPGGA